MGPEGPRSVWIIFIIIHNNKDNILFVSHSNSGLGIWRESLSLSYKLELDFSVLRVEDTKHIFSRFFIIYGST